MGRVFHRGSVWWLKYRDRVSDRIVRESSGSTKEGDAKRLLKRREGASEEGRPVIPRVDKITVGELLDGLKAEYEANGRRSLDRLNISVEHLRPAFGLRRAVHVTGADITAYATTRQAAGGANGTINREVAALKRAYARVSGARAPEARRTGAHHEVEPPDAGRTGAREARARVPRRTRSRGRLGAHGGSFGDRSAVTRRLGVAHRVVGPSGANAAGAAAPSP